MDSRIFWRIVTNPAFEVVVAIIAVLFAMWVVIETEAFQSHGPVVPFAHK